MTVYSNLRNRKLKDSVLLFLLTTCLLTSNLANAQTKTIKFESGTWEEIKTKSAKENKPIFLDAYAKWCGICKKMDKTVFTKDSVADYFNNNFINAKMDMESGEGIGLAREYNVNIYPTFLFINEQGKILHRAVGGMQENEFLELARDVQNPDKQNAGVIKTYDAPKTKSNRTEIGFNISQYQKDFGIGLHVLSPYFFGKMVAIKIGANWQWFENYNGTEITWTSYQNFRFGMRGRSAVVNDNISVYGEGGMFMILPNSDFSSESLVVGGYGLFGFEFRISPAFAYFIELGAVGTGATADKIATKPIYSNGFLTNVGLKIGF